MASHLCYGAGTQCTPTSRKIEGFVVAAEPRQAEEAKDLII